MTEIPGFLRSHKEAPPSTGGFLRAKPKKLLVQGAIDGKEAIGEVCHTESKKEDLEETWELAEVQKDEGPWGLFKAS